MKAVAVFPEERVLRVIDDVPEPRIEKPTQVRIRTLEVGLCGTDQEIARFQYGTPPEGAKYLILGHEALGEVVEVGEGVKGLEPGDLVVPRVRRPCPRAECRPCREGRPDFCLTGAYTERGIQKAHGFMVERFVEEVGYLHRVPKALRKVAVLTEPLTIGEKALKELEQIQARLPWGRAGTAPLHAVVLGAGPVGLLGAMALRRAGFATTVYSYSRQPDERSALVEALGGRYLSSQDVTPSALEAKAGAVDVVYEATGASRFSFDVLGALGPNGIFIFTGVPGRREPLQLEGGTLMKSLVLKNQVVLGTVNAGPDAFDAALDDLQAFTERWPGALERLITTRYPLEAVPEALTGKSDGIKRIVHFG
ncbi:MAG TPA: glucose 1-dehydrogenase [Myxococcaceae bacterium]|nr:glucose 1-dehydrogenase [Myxococcaceae bacterium]